MSLYEYNLYLIRELNAGDLLPEIFDFGDLTQSGDEAVAFDQLGCMFRESVNKAHPSYPLSIVTLTFDEVQIEEALRSQSQNFVDWLFNLFLKHDIAYAFMGGGSYSAYYEQCNINAEAVFRQLGDLVGKGIIEFIHPLMFFSERIAQGKLCLLPEKTPYFYIRKEQGRGCLLILIAGDIRTGVEIIDPGSLYPEIKRIFEDKSI